MRRHQVILWGALLLAAAPVRAQEGAAFLKVGYGARGVALANSYTALADDSDALYWNPGALALTGRAEASMTRAQMFLGDTYDAVSLAVPLGDRMTKEWETLGYRRTATAVYQKPSSRGVLGFGFARLGHADQEGRGADRSPTGSFDAADMAFSVAYAKPLFGGMSAGLSLKRVQSRIADRSAGTMAADMGAVYRFRGVRNWRVGAAVRNMGPGLRYESQTTELPLNFALGTAFETLPGLLFSGEVSVRPRADRAVLSIGTEYALMPMLSLRGGYMQQQLASTAGAGGATLGGFSGGIGLRWSRFFMDYSFTPFGVLGNVQRVSLRARF